MQQDELLIRTETEVMQLQEKLKDRLKEAQDLSDLTTEVQESSFQLEKTTSTLKTTAIKAKWKILMEFWWLVILIVGVGLLIIYLLIGRK